MKGFLNIVLTSRSTCEYTMAVDFVKNAASSYAKEWKEKLRTHAIQLIEQCHTLVCDTKDDEYITSVKVGDSFNFHIEFFR